MLEIGDEEWGVEQVSYPVQSSFIAINVNVLSGVADTINFDLFNYL